MRSVSTSHPESKSFEKFENPMGYMTTHMKVQSHLDKVKNRTYLKVSAVFNDLERDVDAPQHILMKCNKALSDNVDKAYENILERTPQRLKLV